MPGVHLSALHASEPAIYGRFGYGLAALELSVALGRGTTLTAPHLDAEAAAAAHRARARPPTTACRPVRSAAGSGPPRARSG